MKHSGIILLLFAFGIASCEKSPEDLVAQKVKSLSEMSELGTVEYTVKKIIKADDAAWYKYGERKILFSSISYLKAGVDMKNFSADKVVIDKGAKSITATLPKPKLLSFNMPPESIHQEFVNVSGFRLNFSPEEKQNLKVQAEEDIIDDIPNLGILEDAEENARDFFVALFSLVGYDNITVNFE